MDKYRREIAIISAWLILAGLLLMLLGCASTRDNETKQKTVEVTKTTTVVPAMVIDTPVGQVAVRPSTITQLVERSEDTTTNAHEDSSSRPNIPSEAYSVAGSALGTLLPGLGGAGAVALAAWRMLADKNKQIDYHKRDAEEAWNKADERALQLPPKEQKA